jgi:hypothetical protein
VPQFKAGGQPTYTDKAPHPQRKNPFGYRAKNDTAIRRKKICINAIKQPSDDRQTGRNQLTQCGVE